MKTSCPLLRLFTAFLFLAAGSLHAAGQINPYDLLGRTLVPIASIFSPQNEQHALAATLVLEKMTGLPTEQRGGRLDLLLEPPTRVLLRGSFAGQSLAACRVGDEIWLEPGQKIAALVPPPTPPTPGKKKKKKKGERRLAPMALPFPPQQLALLPVLFVVKEGSPVDGLRVLEVQLMPPLAASLGVAEWSARLYYQGEDLARLEILRPGWHLVVGVERLEFQKTLPPESWNPASEDVLRLTGEQALRWLEQAGETLTRQAIPGR